MNVRRLFLSRHRRACLANLDLALSDLPAPLRQRPRPEPSPLGSPSAPVRVLVIDEADVATSP